MMLTLLLAKDPMFSQGQIYFAIGFFIVFTIITVFMYRKDRMLHKKNYKGVPWILVGFLAFFLFLLALKFGLKG
jgi:mannose/fructose/N-acetylgalactosamine-specific phosphotransferase system component IIC